MIVTAVRALLHEPYELTFEPLEIDIGALPADHVYARTDHSAVSIGTEKAAYIGMSPLRRGPQYPRFMGYCNAARVVAVGAGVTGVSPGQRILTHQSHQSAFAIPADDVLAVLPETVSTRVACLTYLAHIGLGGLQRAGTRRGESVVVQGLGPIGLAAIAVARELGSRVVAIGNVESRLSMARKMGAEVVAIDDGKASALVAEHTAGKGADVVFTTVNGWDAWRTSLEMVREFGRVSVVGFPGRGYPLPEANPLDPGLFYAKQITVISAGLAAGPEPWGDGDRKAHLKTNMAWLVAKLDEGLPLSALITHEVAWRDLKTIYERAAQGDKTLVAGILDWSGAT